jgi:hypothetical protein
MRKNEIEEFIEQSIQQVKTAIPKGCLLGGKIDFDLSLITTKQGEGKIGIHLASIKGSSKVQQVHRISFSIIDEDSQAMILQQVRDMLQMLKSELSQPERKKSRKKK